MNIPIKYIGKICTTSKQKDAQEFLGFVMDGIYEYFNTVCVHIAFNPWHSVLLVMEVLV